MLQIQELTGELESLKTQLKEKEQLNRISSYKLNDLKRSIKHNQLKPLGPKAGDGDGSVISGQSPGNSVDDGRLRGSRPSHKNINTSRKQLAPLNS